MGNERSHCAEEEDDPWWNPPKQNKALVQNSVSTVKATPKGNNDDKLDEFRQELARKREKRREIMEEKRKEMQELRDEVQKRKEENEQLRQMLEQRKDGVLRQENERLKKEIVELKGELTRNEKLTDKNIELRTEVAKLQEELQLVNAEVVAFEKERFEYQTHVTALEDVVRVSKQMLVIREHQLAELRQKIADIEASVAGKEMNVLSEDLRREYERQMHNIRSLRILYEERQRAERKEKEELAAQLDDAKKDLEGAQAKKNELEERIAALEGENSKKYDHITNLESNLGLAKAECRQLQAEMAVINQLFSHILLGFNNGQEMDLDKLIKLLEENHDLLQDIVIKEEFSASSAMPKVLLDLINQISDKESNEDSDTEKTEEQESQNASHQLSSPAEIVKNLPKVWKVLIELLSQQNPPVNILTEEDEDDPCYKTVQTAKGPSLALSVSQTFIRLKDLILEKKSLEKETTRLKQLNSHLEVRLQDQEKRLELVCSELSKTWHVVGKMQKQHQHLHTQEKILRYELAQKRKLLTELKEELEYCREKWLQAREKNSSTEAQWKQLRSEFASRKTLVNDDYNNSQESGYSDERECSSTDEEEPGYETDISECHKVSSPEPVSEDVQEGHLSSEQDKTDFVQNTEKAEVVVGNEKTAMEEAGTSTEDPRMTEDQAIGSEKAVAAEDMTGTEKAKVDNEEVLRNVGEQATNLEKTKVVATDEKTGLEKAKASREERLRRMEEQAKELMAKVACTTSRSVQLENKLDSLHEAYGEGSGVQNTRNSDEQEPSQVQSDSDE